MSRGLTRVWLAAVLFATIYAVLGFDRYLTYHAGSDTGLFTQVIGSAFGRFGDTPEAGSHFLYHFSPDLVFCAPLLLLTHSPLALVAMQAIAGALVAPPLFLLARRRLPEREALLVAVITLCYPPLAGLIFADFHENGIAPAATLWLLWALDARRYRVAVAVFAFALGIKEDQAPILASGAAIFALTALRRGERRRAISLATAGIGALVVFFGYFTVVRPAVGATTPWNPRHFYAWGSEPADGAWYGRPAYALEALAPLAFVPATTPAIVLALPGFAEVLGSRESITYTMGQHYSGVWIGYVLYAFAIGAGAMWARSSRRAKVVIRVALGLCLVILAFASPTHWGHYLRLRSSHDRARDRVIAALPATLAVGTSDDLFAHLGFDPNAELGLERDPPYALIDERDRSSALDAYWTPVVLAGVRHGRYRRILADDGVALYARVGGGRPR